MLWSNRLTGREPKRRRLIASRHPGSAPRPHCRLFRRRASECGRRFSREAPSEAAVLHAARGHDPVGRHHLESDGLGGLSGSGGGIWIMPCMTYVLHRQARCCAVRLQIGRVDHHRLGLLRLCRQFGHDRGEHAPPAPPLPPIVERLRRPADLHDIVTFTPGFYCFQ